MGIPKTIGIQKPFLTWYPFDRHVTNTIHYCFWFFTTHAPPKETRAAAWPLTLYIPVCIAMCIRRNGVVVCHSFRLATHISFGDAFDFRSCLHYYADYYYCYYYHRIRERDEKVSPSINAITWNRTCRRAICDTLTFIFLSCFSLVSAQCVCLYVTQENNKQFDISLDSREFYICFCHLFRFICCRYFPVCLIVFRFFLFSFFSFSFCFQFRLHV